MALIDHCIENLPEHPVDPLTVPIPNLAHRVLELYWRQVRPLKVTIFGSPPVSAREFLALPGGYVRLRSARR